MPSWWNTNVFASDHYTCPICSGTGKYGPRGSPEHTATCLHCEGRGTISTTDPAFEAQRTIDDYLGVGPKSKKEPKL